MIKHCLFVATLMAIPFTNITHAAPTFLATVVDNSAGGAALSGHTTYDLFVNYGGGGFLGTQIILDLDAGAIYQDGFGGNSAPNPAIVDAFASAGFDTFYTIDGLTADTVAGGALNAPGAAVDIDAARPQSWSTSSLNQAWAPVGDVVKTLPNPVRVARITLTNNAAGNVRLLAQDEAPGFFPLAIGTGGGAFGPGGFAAIVNVPEPSSFLFLGLVGSVVSLCRFKFKK